MEVNLHRNASVVLRTLAYYDIFNYPLSIDDLIKDCNLQDGDEKIHVNLLNHMVKEGMIYFINGYYSLQNEPHHVEARIRGNEKASKWMIKAQWFSALISRFPYVRGVALSGSLSKGFIGNDPDIDYFIITRPGRLWFARTLLVLFKKVFLLNSYKYFCINYFISTEDLEIEEKNIFSATELATMIPVFGKEVNYSFIKTNRWVRRFYPNFLEHDNQYIQDRKPGYFKRSFEYLFNNFLGDKLDSMFMNYTTRHWYKKFSGKMTQEELNLVFKSSKKISKHHPRNYQKYVLDEYQKRMEYIKMNYNIQIESPFYDMNKIAS